MFDVVFNSNEEVTWKVFKENKVKHHRYAFKLKAFNPITMYINFVGTHSVLAKDKKDKAMNEVCNHSWLNSHIINANKYQKQGLIEILFVQVLLWYIQKTIQV